MDNTDVTRSTKQGYKWSHKKDSCPPKRLFLSILWLMFVVLPDGSDQWSGDQSNGRRSWFRNVRVWRLVLLLLDLHSHRITYISLVTSHLLHPCLTPMGKTWFSLPPQTKFTKVMFWQASVIMFIGGSASRGGGLHPPQLISSVTTHWRI